jgi:hypothetical protein
MVSIGQGRFALRWENQIEGLGEQASLRPFMGVVRRRRFRPVLEHGFASIQNLIFYHLLSCSLTSILFLFTEQQEAR